MPRAPASYNLPLPDGTQIPVAIDPDQDASAFISVLLRFLARHPDIQHNPVIIVGESYGGTRALLMLEQLLDYEALVDGVGLYHNASVHAEIARHLEGWIRRRSRGCTPMRGRGPMGARWWRTRAP